MHRGFRRLLTCQCETQYLQEGLNTRELDMAWRAPLTVHKRNPLDRSCFESLLVHTQTPPPTHPPARIPHLNCAGLAGATGSHCAGG